MNHSFSISYLFLQFGTLLNMYFVLKPKGDICFIFKIKQKSIKRTELNLQVFLNFKRNASNELNYICISNQYLKIEYSICRSNLYLQIEYSIWRLNQFLEIEYPISRSNYYLEIESLICRSNQHLQIKYSIQRCRDRIFDLQIKLVS